MALKHRIIIRAERPWLRRGLIAAAVAVLALGAWGLYHYTRTTTVSDFQRAQLERDQLRSENRTLSRKLRAAREDNLELKDQLAYLNSSKDIDRDACAMVKKSLAGLQQDNSNLREQLAFYRGIVSPKESSEGLRIYDFKVDGRSKSDVYDFDLLLVQVIHHDRRVSGTAQVRFDGVQDGKSASYSLSSLALGKDPSLDFAFKYFQEIEGRFKLPKGFRPLRVTVTLDPKQGLPKVENEYDWAKIRRGMQGTS